MSMKHKNSTYSPDPIKGTPFNTLDKQYDSLIGEERRAKYIWMIISLVLVLYVVASILGWLYAINLPKSVPMVISVAPWGEAMNMGDISEYSYGTIEVPETARHWQVKDFIRKLRTISSDSKILYDNVTLVFSMITRSIEEKVKEQFRNPDVFSLVGKKTVSLVFESIIRVSEKSYQVDWIETATGEDAGQRRYRGVFSIELLEPSKSHEITNPLGIYIMDYDITEITGVYE